VGDPITDWGMRVEPRRPIMMGCGINRITARHFERDIINGFLICYLNADLRRPRISQSLVDRTAGVCLTAANVTAPRTIDYIDGLPRPEPRRFVEVRLLDVE